MEESRGHTRMIRMVRARHEGGADRVMREEDLVAWGKDACERAESTRAQRGENARTETAVQRVAWACAARGEGRAEEITTVRSRWLRVGKQRKIGVGVVEERRHRRGEIVDDVTR